MPCRSVGADPTVVGGAEGDSIAIRLMLRVSACTTS